MGAEWFTHSQDGADPEVAFRAAVEAACYEYGHGGYTGTIAEKNGYRIITETTLTEQDAEALAWNVWDEALPEGADPEVLGKWGPAAAIPVFVPTRTVDDVVIPSYVRHRDATWEQDQRLLAEAVAPVLTTQGHLRPGETVRRVIVHGQQDATRAGVSPTLGERPAQEVLMSVRCTVVLNKDPFVLAPAAVVAQQAPDGWLFCGWASC